MPTPNKAKPGATATNSGNPVNSKSLDTPTKNSSPADAIKARVRRLLGPAVDLYLPMRKGGGDGQ